jgi:hypothetical protein
LQLESAPGEICKKLMRLVIVSVHSNAVIAGGAVELRKE